MKVKADCYNDSTKTVHLKCYEDVNEIKRCDISLEGKKNNVKYLYIIRCESLQLNDFVNSFENLSKLSILSSQLDDTIYKNSSHSKQLKKTNYRHSLKFLHSQRYKKRIHESLNLVRSSSRQKLISDQSSDYHRKFQSFIKSQELFEAKLDTPENLIDNIDSETPEKTIENEISESNADQPHYNPKNNESTDESIWNSTELQAICIVIIIILTIILFGFIGFLIYDHSVNKTEPENQRTNMLQALYWRIRTIPNHYVK